MGEGVCFICVHLFLPVPSWCRASSVVVATTVSVVATTAVVSTTVSVLVAVAVSVSVAVIVAVVTAARRKRQVTWSARVGPPEVYGCLKRSTLVKIM